jgi:hypothetical protein
VASGKSVYLRNAVLNGVLNGNAFASPATLYVCLSTAAYTSSATGSSMSEVSGGNYGRVALSGSTTNFPTATSSYTSNGVAITFPTANASWGTVLSFYLTDDPTSGNVLYGGDLTSSRVINSSDTASFGTGQLVIAEQ